MKQFFGDDVLLSTDAAKELYEGVKDLPIVDYHCHLNENQIKDNYRFSDLGELWLGGDHYKWRSMRICGVDEYYITGGASFYEKYLKYAEIFPRLCGSPLYYWTQMELKMIFGIDEPLCSESAERICEKANEVLKNTSVADLLKKFRVQFIATTDDATATLAAHGKYGDTLVSPTFRPDKVLNMEKEALDALSAMEGESLDTLDDLKNALASRLRFFRSKGCRIADHGIDYLPVANVDEATAASLFARRETLTAEEKHVLFSHLLAFLAALYAKEGMVMQLHFSAFRNVNTTLFSKLGRDVGFDIMRENVNTDDLVRFLDELTVKNALPKTVLYTLNPVAVPALATLSGAFRNVIIGAAWWFNDTMLGIRHQLENIAEYAVLGTNFGMLTDSRSFASYVRFDFFRRILADFVGGYVERGEYSMAQAKDLMYAVCYKNVAQALGL